VAELDQLRAAGWRESVFIVDDNFVGNKQRAKELCAALAEWRRQFKTNFDFSTEASLNLADDPELMQLMKDAGFKSVFLGIEPKPGERVSRQRWLTRGNARAVVTSIVRQGVFGRQRWSYWKFMLTVATRYRRSIGVAMTLTVMGYHFEVMTRKLLAAVEAPVQAVGMNGSE
jgi:hypothetical protein